MSNDDIIWNVKKNSILKLAEAGKRIDDRAFDEYRKIELINNYVPRAEGSTLIKLGKTQLIAGVKVETMTPFPDTPEEGILMINGELVPIASNDFFSGPPDEDSIELARVVDRGVRESKMVDVSKLCITPGELVYSVMVDIHVLDYDGNLFDAANIAVVNALWNAKMPKVEDGKIVKNDVSDKEYSGFVPVKEKPMSCTFVKLGSKNLIDPIIDEEKVSDCRMTMTITEKDCMCAAQKSNFGFYSKADLDEMLDMAILKSKENRKFIVRE